MERSDRADDAWGGIRPTVSEPERDKLLDGFRAVAVLAVIFEHAVVFRFADLVYPGSHVLKRLAGPVSEIGVQVFFVISGFIITTLLAREEADGRPNLAAFYVRRSCRILPPFFAYLLTIAIMRGAGSDPSAWESVVRAGAFTCNTSLPECEWWVAHSWSLAVEEQFYLCWPLLFLLLPRTWQVRFLAGTLVALLCVYLTRAHVSHGNALSFACIAAGALLALEPRLAGRIAASAHPLWWSAALVVLVIGPLTPFARLAFASAPVLVAYLIFAGRALGFVRATLEARPFQIIGLGSYSLYLWQQLFLASPDSYAAGPFPLLLLPLVVIASVYVIERPFVRIGRDLSRSLKHRKRPSPVAQPA